LAGLGSSQDGANISLKIDHQWSEKNRYFGEWFFNPGKYNNYRLPWTGATFPTSPWGSYDGFGSNLPFDFANQIIAVGNTYTVNPSLINEFRAGFSRQYYTTHPATGGGYPPSVSDLPAVVKLLANSGIPYYPPTPAPSWYVGTPGGSLGWGTIGWTSNMTATESYTILDNVTKLIGKHTLRTGFIYRLSHVAEFQSAPTDLNFDGHGTADPTTGLGGGSGLPQFMLGDVMSTGGGNGGASSFATSAWQPYARDRYWGFYLQDDFRVTPSFTLNLGLRYDIFGAYKTRQGPLTRFCPTCPNSYTGMPGIEQFWGDPGFPKGSDIFAPNWSDLGPRINFSWSPFSNPNTVIRGGYDIFYSNAFSGINSAQQIENQDGYAFDFFWQDSNNPSQCANYNGSCVAWNLDSTGAKGPLTTPVFTTSFPAQQHNVPYVGGLGSADLRPTHDPMVQTWTLEVQHQFKGNLTLTAGYVGTHETHLVGMFKTLDYTHTADALQYRQSLYATVPISQYFSGQTATALSEIYGASSLPCYYLLRAFPAFNGIRQTSEFDGNSVYHAFDLRVEKRYSHGLNFNLAYTWSKSIVNPWAGQLVTSVIDPIHFARNGDVGGLTGAEGGIAGQGFQNPDNVKGDRALSFNDMPHVLNFSTTYELPFGAARTFLNHKGVSNLILGGWRLTGNFNAESGVPLGISGPCDALTCRPNLVGNPKAVAGGQNADHWINGAAFTPPFGSDQSFWSNPDPTDNRWWQFGTAGARLSGLRSPGFWNLDTSLGKQFHVTENKYFDFRWELFNALNHQNLGLPNTNFCLPPNADGSTDLVHQGGCAFGRITNVQTDPRAMEFALKFVW
jgi:hypothetical protein